MSTIDCIELEARRGPLRDGRPLEMTSRAPSDLPGRSGTFAPSPRRSVSRRCLSIGSIATTVGERGEKRSSRSRYGTPSKSWIGGQTPHVRKT